MSRDTGKRTPQRLERPEREAEFLTAYVDGVAELSADERRRIEARLARDPAARADEAGVRSLLDQLRALPPDGGEPDWAAMERSIHDALAVGRSVPRPWWQSWRWLAPTATLATAMVVLLVMWRRPAALPPTAVPERGMHAPPALPEDVVALWLDGAEVDVALSAADLLGDAVPGDDEPALPEPAADAADAASAAELGLLSPADLAWVDRLDDAALTRAERWLAAARALPGSAPGRKG
jgi:hypothetical protein